MHEAASSREALRELGVVFSHELMRNLRSGRTLALLALYGLFSALLLLGLIWMGRGVEQRLGDGLAGAPPEALDQALERSREALLGALFDDAALIDSLSHLPVLIPLAFKVGLFFVPLYVTLLAFDRISGELGPRSLRYVTVRARRGSILWGKLLAQGVLLVAVLVLVQVATVVAARLIDPAVGPRELVELVLRLTVAASVVGLTYLTLTTLCSTLSPVPAVSLVLNIAALFALWLVGAVGAYSEGALRVLQRAEPSFYADGLLSPTLGTFLGSLLAYLMFAVLFGGAAHLVLARRDL